MKNNNVSRTIFGVIAALMMLTVISINPAYAQYPVNESHADKAQIQYSQEELEATRGKILELLDTVQEFSDTLLPNDPKTAEQLRTARKQLEEFSTKDLNALRAGIDPSKMNWNLAQARAALNNFKPALDAYNNKRSRNSVKNRSNEPGSDSAVDSLALPEIESPSDICEALVGSGRPSSEVIIAADAVYFAAKIVDIVLNRTCLQSVLGVNTSLACIVSDTILFAAEQVRSKVSACDDDFTKRSVDVAVKRLETIHSDLESSVANDNANKDTIISSLDTAKTSIVNNANGNKDTIVANDNKNTTTITTAISTGTTVVTGAIDSGTAQIITNDNGNRATIITNDNTNKNTIVANDNANKDTIVANDNANTASIIANDNRNAAAILADAKANKEELKNLTLRTQIEADLSSTDGAAFVALFMTPSSACSPVLNEKGVAQASQQCGYLDLARAIVVQTIANLAGSNTSQANSFLAQGDSYKTAGNYRQAYQNYRLAYKTAAGISTR